MNRPEIPQAEALRLYLTMIAGNEPPGSYFEIRAKRTTGWSQDWIPLREIDRAGASLVNRGQMSDTYLGVAPRTQRGGGLAAIDRVWCLWADCDSIESVKQLAAFRPLPSIVIRSGSEGHAHAYWPLRDPIAPAWAKRANQRIALKLGADRNATDAARIMRPPGTINHKHDQQRPVVCTRLELDVFTVNQIVGGLPDDPSYVARPRRRLATAPAATPTTVVDGLARTVREAAEGNRNASLFWAGCRLAERDLDDDAAREVLRAAALAAGLLEHEVDRTLASALDQRAAA